MTLEDYTLVPVRFRRFSKESDPSPVGWAHQWIGLQDVWLVDSWCEANWRARLHSHCYHPSAIRSLLYLVSFFGPNIFKQWLWWFLYVPFSFYSIISILRAYRQVNKAKRCKKATGLWFDVPGSCLHSFWQSDVAGDGTCGLLRWCGKPSWFIDTFGFCMSTRSSFARATSGCAWDASWSWERNSHGQIERTQTASWWIGLPRRFRCPFFKNLRP